MLAAHLVLTLILLAVCCFAPGFFFLRRLRWTPLEKLCGSVGLSLVLVYLAAWAIYLAGPADPRPAFAAISIVCAALGVWARRDVASLFHSLRVRRVALGYAFLLLWSLAILAIIRIYSGGGWAGDWIEHFQRSLFFLQRFPTDTSIIGLYELPARPPMMNVLAAFFLGQTADRFEIFQVVFAFLNLLPFAGCALMMPRLLRPRRASIVPLVALFAMNPVFMQNATYTWTKSLTAFYVILALWFYLAGWKKQDALRMTAAFLALSAGLLVHYSAGPYCVILGLHYLAVVFRARPRRWRELALFAAPCAFLLLTWFGWSIAVYGVHTTVASNTSITSSRQYQGSTLGKIAGNFVDSAVPALVREPDLFRDLAQPNWMGQLRDRAFLTYQVNLVFSMGVIGGPLVLWLLYRGLRRKAGAGVERNFWRLLIPVIVLLGIAVVGERDRMGVAHLTLLPMEMLGIALVACAASRRRAVALAILAGSLADCSLGVFLQAHVQGMENSPTRTLFTGVDFENGIASFAKPTPDSLSQPAWNNWYEKHLDSLDRQWIREFSRFPVEGAAARTEFQRRLDETTRIWRGWFERHGGSVTYLGDHFGEGWFPTAVFLLLWAALAWCMYDYACRIAPEAAPAAQPAKKARLKAAGRKR